MNRISHASIEQVVTTELIDSLVSQAETTPLPRVRAAVVHQLYGLVVTLGHISKALRRDLEAGDAILNKLSNQEQNESPQTQMWLQWLAMYEAAETQINRILSAIPELYQEAA